MKRLPAYILLAVAGISFISSCSTTRVLEEGQQRLVKNKINIISEKKVEDPDLESLGDYVRQHADGWQPAMSIYNWQDGKGKGWDKFVKKIGKAPTVFDSTQISNSEANLISRLDYLGYYNSKVNSEIKNDKKGKKVTVIYNVTLGRRIPISEYSYNVLQGGDFADAFTKANEKSLIKVGEPLSEKVLEEETVRATSAVRDQGYYDFSKNYFFFEADTVSCPDSARLYLDVKNYTRNGNEEKTTEFHPKYIGDVTVAYPENLKLRTSFLKNLNNIKRGDLYSEKSINNLYSRFNACRLFSAVNVSLTPSAENPDTVNCKISLQKGKMQGFNIGLEASINSSGLFGIVPEISYFHKNLFHGGEWLNISFSTDQQFMFKQTDIRSQEYNVSAELSLPKFWPLPTRLFKGAYVPRTNFKLAYDYQTRPEYSRDRLSFVFGYNGYATKNFTYKFSPFSWNVTRMPYIEENFAKSLENDPFLKHAYSPEFDMGMTATLYYSSLGKKVDNASYWYTQFTFDTSGNIIRLFQPIMDKNSSGQGTVWGIPYAQYIRGELNIGKTFVWGRRDNQSFATRLVIGMGYAYGNSEALPFEKHFYVGGANSLRGWTARTVGPGCSPMETSYVIPNQTGDMRLEANAEYRIKLFWKIAGALFVDAGNIWNIGKHATAESSFNLRTIAASWGAGIRLDLSFLVLRVDLGMRFYNPVYYNQGRTCWVGPQEWFSNDQYAVHFGVGYPF